MFHNQKIQLSPKIEDKVYSRFIGLPLKHKLIVYAKLIHGNSFKSQNNDLFGLNRRMVGTIYRSFIDTLRSDFDAKKGTSSKKSSRKSGKHLKQKAKKSSKTTRVRTNRRKKD
jgi:hypothetical protein